MIKINRINSKVDYDVEYEVVIDTLVVEKIKRNEIKNIYLKPGKHIIEIKSNKYHSNKIEFDLAPDEIIEFEVKPDYYDNLLSKFFTNILYGKVGIKIEIKSDIYM